MLKPEEAKKLFRTSLAILIANLVWPLFAGALTGIAAAANMSMGLVGLTLGVIWLALLIWLIVQIFKIAPHVGVTPWAFLWLLIPVVGVFIIGMLFFEPLKYAADNKPAGERLPWTWELIKETWNFYVKTLRITIKTSVLVLYILLVLGLSTLIGMIWPFWWLVHVPLNIIAGLAMMWVTIKLLLETIQLEAGKQLTGREKEQTNQNFGSYFWISILMYLIIGGPFIVLVIIFMMSLAGIAPALGGTGAEMTNVLEYIETHTYLLLGGGVIAIVLVIAAWIWAIYKSIQYTLALPALLVDKVKGMAALKESARIIKNRWWGMLWKNQLWGIFVGGLTFVLMLAAGIVLSIPSMLFQGGKSAQLFNSLLSQGLQGAIQMLLLPLALAFVVKLYYAFKKTAK
ncbi:MAG: hypothetical protein ACOYUZ_05535 [Patescibacteria group bacterium]